MDERPDHADEPFVEDFVKTEAGFIPRVRTWLSHRDRLDSARIRAGLGRDNYKITPGLYCVGIPGPDSPVIVTANYKLTFDAVRKELSALDAWLLVTDTRGINVWCAAGKGLISAEEINLSIREAHLDEVVNHRTLILPQLCAPGVSARTLKKLSGFKSVFGPVRAIDLPAFIQNGNKATEQMREVTFTLAERAVLTPVEITLLAKPLSILIVVAFLISGIGPSIFSFEDAFVRGVVAAAATGAGIITGCILVPILLPLLPWRAFAPKGALLGGAAGLLTAIYLSQYIGLGEGLSILLWTTSLSSYLAMNFTGSTPYTSPTGVEQEMRDWLPYQLGAVALAAVIWLIAPFVG